MRRTSVILLLLASASAVGAAEPAGPDAAEWLAGALQDAKTGDVVLAALRATKDKELTPLFIALSRSGEKRRRRTRNSHPCSSPSRAAARSDGASSR